MKLREGNVFTRVRHSVQRRYDVTSGLVPCSFQGNGPRGGMGMVPEGDTVYPTPRYLHLIAATEAGMHSC